MEKAYTLKNEEGMLRTIISDSEAYYEMTTTMLFGYAALKGYRLGLLDEKFFRWGVETVKTTIENITPEGYVLKTSGGTDCQEREGYLQVPYVETKYSSGILLMLLSEYLCMLI